MSERRAMVPARQAHIELLRARAAYERHALTIHATELGRELSPKRWFSQLLNPSQESGSGGGQRITSLLGQGIALATQYPYVAATLSSIFVGKRWRWFKWVGAGLAAWQIAVGSARASKTNEP